MCQKHENGETKSWSDNKKYRLADFFNAHWDTYKKSPKEFIREEQYKAVNAIRVCQTDRLGIDYYACPDCGEETKIYHSCKNRFCPTCSWMDTVKWADRIKNQMLDIAHRHVVITLPHSLNNLIKDNDCRLLSLLFQIAAQTFKDWMQTKYNLKPGIISVLHTFGETKEHHVHVHMIVSWGGIENHTNKLKPIQGEFVNYNFLKDKFRAKFEDQLVSLFDDGSLIHNYSSRIEFMKFIKRINQQRWILHLEPPMKIPTQVVRYIGRYSKRACLSEYKITNIEGENLSFTHKDYKNTDINNKPILRELTLNYTEFFPRLLQHVPYKYFRLVRYYGVYSSRSHIEDQNIYHEKEDDKITDSQEIQEYNQSEWGKLQKKKTGENPLICKHCKKEKQYIYTKMREYDGRVVTFKRMKSEPEGIPDLICA